MADSILDSVKKVLGLDASYDPFDPDIIMHINTVFATLNQIGIGPNLGFAIDDNSATWDAFLGAADPTTGVVTVDPRLNSIKTYVYLRVRILFDPPQTQYLMSAMKEQIQELEWRLSVNREGTAWVDPNPPVVTDPTAV